MASIDNKLDWIFKKFNKEGEVNNMRHYPEAFVDVEYVNSDGDVSVADIAITIHGPGGEFFSTRKVASAKRNRVDRENDFVGVKLAVGRALEKLGRSLQRNAWGEVKHQDDVRELKEEAAKRPKKQKGLTVTASKK